MERFLYSAERRLRTYKIKNPLLIYRNDGASSRVAKSVALKTYSSGPRGGLEGTRALAQAYELPHVLMIDVGGTTTDVGTVKNYAIATERRGRIAGIPVSYELSDVKSAGVGGSSIIAVENGRIVVGPESVGAAPGPACFGFGGKKATITDVNLLLGVLDPDTYLDGEMFLDAERSRAVISESVAEPLGISVEEALIEMAAAYAAKVAESFAAAVESAETTTVAAFGGGGPMSACDAARLAECGAFSSRNLPPCSPRSVSASPTSPSPTKLTSPTAPLRKSLRQWMNYVRVQHATCSKRDMTSLIARWSGHRWSRMPTAR